MKFILYKLAQFLSNVLPLRLAYWVSERIADIELPFYRRERKAVRGNLEVISGGSPTGAKYSSRAVFRNFAKYLVEFCRFPGINRGFVDEFVSLEGLENLDSALALGRGAIVLTAHIGNWEMAGVVLSVLGYKVNAVALSHADRRVNELFTGQRRRMGINVIPIGNAVRKTFSSLARNEIVGLLGDRAFSKSTLDVEFLGRTAKVPRGPAAISVKKNVPVVPCFLIRCPGNRFLFAIEPAIEPTGSEEADMERMAKRYMDVVARYVKAYPEQWFIFNDFFEQHGTRGRP